MYIDFEQMSDKARIWIYQANRFLTEDEVIWTETQGKFFVEQWTAHQQTLKGSFKVFYNRFVVVAVDEDFNQVSGCSIDASVHFLKDIEQILKLDLFDRTLQAYFINDIDIEFMALKDIKTKIQAGEIYPETLVFNHLIETKEDLQDKWRTQAKDTWLARYF